MTRARFRLGWRPEYETWLMMSALLVLCSLPLVAILVLPLFGATAAAITAPALVLGIFTICYLICVPRARHESPTRSAQAQRERPLEGM